MMLIACDIQQVRLGDLVVPSGLKLYDSVYVLANMAVHMNRPIDLNGTSNVSEGCRTGPNPATLPNSKAENDFWSLKKIPLWLISLDILEMQLSCVRLI